MMKKFIIKSLIFIIPSYFFLLLVDIIISTYIQPAGNLHSWQELYSGEIDADLIIFGSSRAQKSFKIKMIEDTLNIKVYNLGLINARMQISYFRLLELLKFSKRKPKYITLEIDYFTIESINNLNKHWQIFPYMLYNENCYKCTKDMEGYKSGYYFFPIVRYSGNFIDLIKNSFEKKPKNYYKGGYTQDTHFDKEWKEENDTVKITPEIDNKKIEYLLKFIKKCKEENIKLNFIYVPEFFFVNNKITNKELLTKKIKLIAEQKEIPFADYSNIKNSKDTAYFYDMRHLNSKGADKFTSEYYIPWIKELYGL